MTRKRMNPVKRFLRDQSGQTMVLAAVFFTVLLGMCGFVVDLGHAMVVNRQLQAGTNAAAQAAGYELPSTSYSSEGTTFSTTTSDNNAYGNLPNVTTSVAGYCSTWIATNMAISCGGAAGDNAVVVTQKVTIPTYFISVLGIQSITLSSTALAAERGATPIPYNVAIIVDATASMSTEDSDSQCNTTRFQCAFNGVATMLENLAPCPSTMATCNTATTPSTSGTSTASNSNSNYGSGITTPQEDSVALFSFPNVSQTTAPDSFDCTGTKPTNEPYSFPGTTIDSSSYYAGTSEGSSLVATYMDVGFTSDFKTNPSSSTLANKSAIVKAIGFASSCTGMNNPGGEGTYYAGSIYAAAQALEAQQKTYPNTQNALVIVSDGDANAISSHMYNCGTGTTCYTGTTYPSILDQCNQAVVAGQAATTAGIKVYGVSYGSESSGCQTGNTGGTTGETAAQTGYTANITPCETIKGIASSAANFYSDYTQSGSGNDTTCVGTATSTSNLNQIFSDIAYQFTTTRLLTAPAGCTASNASSANCDPTAQ
jgi:Flp pilus assembly protein TadG